MLYPLPAVMVSTADRNGEDNIITVAWTGTVCTNPAMLYISVRPERYSYHMIRESGEFAVNLTTERLAKATDWCGVRSGRDADKWKETGLTRGKAERLQFAHMVLAEVLAVQAEEECMREDGKFELNSAGLIAYSHGEYFSLGESHGRFGWSVKKEKKR